MLNQLHLRLLLIPLLGLLAVLYLYPRPSQWIPLSEEHDPPSEHADFIEGLTKVYNTLIELDYVEPSDISFPPHPASALLLPSSSDASELEFDIYGLLQQIPQFRAEVIAAHAPSGGPQIVQNSRAITYLGDVNVTALRETTPGSPDLLPSSIIRIAMSTSDTGSNIAYDMASSKSTLILSALEPLADILTEHILQYQPNTPPGPQFAEGYFTNWHQKLRTQEWVAWPGTLFQGIRPRPLGYIEFFHNEHAAPQIEANFKAQYEVHKTMGMESESVATMMERHIGVVKAEYNMYWSMRVVYEQAGWPGMFSKERFRRGVDEWEKGWRAVTAEHGKDVKDIVEGKALREWYRKSARNHAV